MYPFEPVFRAAEVMNPMLDCDDLDIVINRNSLRKLFNFLSGSLTDSFCVGLAMVHNTLFVERCERSARELIRGSRQSGWGHSFEKTSTRVVKEGDRSTQHHRILRYDLGHLSCLVRFEVDACYEEDPGDKEKMAAINTQDDLVLKLGKLSFGSTSNSDQNSSTHVHMAQRQFMPMPQSTAAEMKTSRQNVTKFLPQMWFGRTPWLIRGNHVEGTFDRVDILNIESKFQEWEIRNQAKLRSMVTLLSQLREAVKVNGSKRCIAIYGKGGQFEVFESTTQNNPLPDDLIRKFWGRAES
ncbi:hypothetical protein F5Y16DRAFT_357016 [Xylariaceae sp. FL0255]|nr:hypothetical protein F5Y16DRAFT_357016 [Xylariaceae sp. FL0255]